MIIILHENATEQQVQEVVERLVERGFDIHRSTGMSQVVLGVVGDTLKVDSRDFALLDGVRKVVRISQKYKLAGRAFQAKDSIVKAGPVAIGGKNVVLMAGTNQTVSDDNLRKIGQQLKNQATSVLCVESARTMASSDTVPGEEFLKRARDLADEFGFALVSEVSDRLDIDTSLKYVDMILAGSQNMFNHGLLKEFGRIDKPVLLKRATSATLTELLVAAENIMVGGNRNVVLCETGVRTFDHDARFALDIGAITTLKDLTHLPVVVDPCRVAQLPNKVAPICRAAIAAGADGLLVEVHDDPGESGQDGGLALSMSQYEELVESVRPIAAAVKRELR